MSIDEPGSVVPSPSATPSNSVLVAPRPRTPMAVDVLGPIAMAVDEPGSVLPAAPRLKTPMAVDEPNSIASCPA